MKEPIYRLLNCHQGREIIANLRAKYPRKTVDGNPLDTYAMSCQADVIDHIERMIKEHIKPQAGETGARNG